MPIPTKAPLMKTNAKELVYDQIREWIIDGTLEPNEWITEAELSSAIDTSRTPVREAMQRLSNDGLVVMQNGLTTRVAPLETQDVAAIYYPLASIEGLAAKLAADRVTSQEIDRLTEIDKGYQRALRRGSLRLEIKRDREFHAAILEIADNGFVTKFANHMYSHVTRFETYFFEQQGHGMTMNERSHANIIAALRAHQPELAAQAMSLDWLETMQKIKASF